MASTIETLLLLALTAASGVAAGAWGAKRLRPAPTAPTRAKPPRTRDSTAPLRVARNLHNGPRTQTYSSWFAFAGGWVGAAHSVEGGGAKPDFAYSQAITRPGGLDAALYGVQLTAASPRAPIKGELVVVRGYPAGSDIMAERYGYVYMERPGEAGTWIVVFHDGEELVVSGMSGGPITALEGGEVLGILITQNGRADVDLDGDEENSCDMVALSAVWAAMGSPSAEKDKESQ